MREHFFGRDPRTKALVENMSDSEIWNLKRGGHDYRKVYAAYRAAVDHKGQPTVILAKTIKGYSLGAHFQGRNATHQMKKLALEDLKDFRDSMRIPISDAQLEEDPYLPPYYHPGSDAPEIRYMLDRRRTLGGLCPRTPDKDQGAEASRPRHLRPAEEGIGAARRSPPPWRPCAPSKKCCGTRRLARGSCRSFPTRRARSAWTRGSRR